MIRTRFRKPVLAVQWDRGSVDYVVAEAKGGHVTIKAVGSIARSKEEDEDADVVSPADLLRDELQRLGVRRPDLLVALGRASVDVVPLQLPPAGESELPTLVANQVVRDAGEIAESGVVDFVPLEAVPDHPRQVFAFTVDGATIEQLRGEATKLGANLCAVVYRALSSVTLLQRLVPQSLRTMVLITLHDREADLSIVRNGHLLYTRTARLVETDNLGDVAAQLAVEVRRSLAAASLTADGEEQHLYVFGAWDDSEQLVQDLAEDLSLPASLLDPLRSESVAGSLPANVGRLAPLVGLIHEHFERAHPLNFMHPKQPPPPPNYYRRAGFYAAAALMLLGVGGYLAWESGSQAEEEITALREKLDDTTARLNKIKQRQAVVDAIWQWQTDNVNWLDELYDLTKRLPNGRDARIRRLAISPGGEGQQIVTLSVDVRDPAVLTQLGDQLRDAFHDVRSNDVSEQPGSTDYPWQFETRITLRPRDTEEYRKSFPTPSNDGRIAATPVSAGENK